MDEDSGAGEGRDGARRPRRRRAASDGALYQRSSDDRWVGRIKLPGGGHRYFTGRTEREVRARLRQALRAAEDGEPVPDARLTVGAYLESWIAGLPGSAVRGGGEIKASTLDYYRRYLRKHIIGSELARKPLARLEASDLRQLYVRKVAEGLSARTCHHLNAILHRALGDAVSDRNLARNAAAGVKKPGIAKVRMTVLQRVEGPRGTVDDQAARFLTAIRGERLESLFVVAVTAGLRQGELLGLRWRDVSLERGQLRVTGSLQGMNRGGLCIGATKTGRERDVALAARAVAALRDHRARQLEERLRAGSRWVDRDLVFTTEIGDYLTRAILRHALDRILREAGLPDIRFHDLRHTAATRMLEGGINPKVVSEMLGHSSVAITLDLYSHATTALQRQAQEAVWGGPDA